MHEMTLPAMLQHAANQASKQGIGYIQKDGSVLFQTYPQLLKEASSVLARLYQLGLKAGDKVILALTRNEESIPAFWGCLLGGIIPVPLSPTPSLHSPNPALEKLHSVWKVLGKPPVFVSPNLLSGEFKKPHHVCSIPEDNLRTLPGIEQDHPAASFHTAQLTDTAFIRFSSGSTGQPKGVVLSHQNILCNLLANEAGLKMNREDVFLN